jgi:hypothetical protein
VDYLLGEERSNFSPYLPNQRKKRKMCRAKLKIVQNSRKRPKLSRFATLFEGTAWTKRENSHPLRGGGTENARIRAGHRVRQTLAVKVGHDE